MGRVAVIRAPQVPRIAREIRESIHALAEHAAAVERRHSLDVRVSAFATLDARVQFADLYLVSREMTHAAVDAARDVPAMTIVDSEPCRTGIMVFDGGLPPIDLPPTPDSRGVTRVGAAVPEVLVWTRDAELAYLSLWAPRSRLPGWLDAVLPAAVAWSVVTSCQIDPHDAGEWDLAREESVRTVSLALAAWTMMAIPTVADAAERTVVGEKIPGQRRRAPARAVKVIELRKLAHRPIEADEEGDRTRVYRHRWIVRGHWRQQRVGEGRTQTRTTWIPSYVKGPENAPLLDSETVFVWRR